MRREYIDDSFPAKGSVLIDNAGLASAIRLLNVDYDILKADTAPGLRGNLLMHDILALSAPCEALVLSESIYVNGQFVSGWTSNDLAEPLLRFVVALDSPEGLAESLRRLTAEAERTRLDMHPVDLLAANLVFPSLTEDDRVNRPSAESRLQAGTAFYMFASEFLSLPYSASPLRARLVGPCPIPPLATVRGPTREDS